MRERGIKAREKQVMHYTIAHHLLTSGQPIPEQSSVSDR